MMINVRGDGPLPAPIRHLIAILASARQDHDECNQYDQDDDQDNDQDDDQDDDANDDHHDVAQVLLHLPDRGAHGPAGPSRRVLLILGQKKLSRL